MSLKEDYEVNVNIGVQNKTQTPLYKVDLHFLKVSCEFGFKVSKKCSYDITTLSCKLESWPLGYQKSSELYADFETIEKNGINFGLINFSNKHFKDYYKEEFCW
jgi:hypothetical protein